MRNRYFSIKLNWGLVFLSLVVSIGILLCLTFLPLVARIRKTGPDRIDILLHNGFAPDYSVYLATITMGQSGKLFFRNYFSPTETKPLPIHSLYWITGFITRPFHLWPPYAYHLIRSITVFGYGMAVFLLCRIVLKKPWKALMGILVILLIPIAPLGFYHYEIPGGQWWENWLEATKRIDPPPHHLAGQVFLFLAIAGYLLYKQKKQIRWIVVSAVFSVFSVFMVPHTVFAFLAILAVDVVLSVLEAIRRKTVRMRIKDIVIPLFLCGITLLAVGILSLALKGTRWIPNQQWEVAYWARDPYFYYHLYISFLPLLILSVPSVLSIIKGDRIRLLLLIWAITPLCLSPFLPTLGMGTGRLIQLAIHIPLGLLAVSTITDFVESKHIRPFFVCIALFLFVLYAGYTLLYFVEKRVAYVHNEPISWQYYVPKSIYDGAEWARSNIAPDTHIITPSDIGNIFVSFAPIVAYQGDQTHGYNWDLDSNLLYQFYSHTLTDTGAKEWLTNKKISYVVDEISNGPHTPVESYPFLIPVWENFALRIYRVQ
jgi:hypothetical protein